MARFQDLRFGFADAETEGSEDPDLLLRGFFDENGWTTKILEKPHSLVLGPKGAGKTAIATHLHLSGAETGSVISQSINLREFPFRQFRQIAGQSEDDVSRIPDTWSWLLSLLMIEIMSHDDRLDAPPSFLKTRSALQSAGAISGAGVPSLIRAATKSSLRVKVAALIDYQLEGHELDLSVGPNFGSFVRRFRQILLEADVSCPVVLFIDGLDEIDIADATHLSVLGGLIDAAAGLNRDFRRRGRRVKVVVLCRTDVFDLIDSPNKNKVRQDLGLELDWYDQVQNPLNARLIRLADTKGRVVDPNLKSVLSEHFPSRIKGRSPASFLADRTRHLPRDYLRLLSFIQESTANGVTWDAIADGIRRYSHSYFLPEIRDTMSGFCSAMAVKSGFAVLGSVARPEFTIDDLNRSSVLADADIADMEKFLVALFECGGLGMVELVKGKHPHYAFKYRTATRSLDPEKRLRLHPGLWPALNVLT